MSDDGIRRVQARRRDVQARKSSDYSKDNLAWEGTPGVVSRLVDKVVRARNLVQKMRQGEGTNFESLRDTMEDIANYGDIGCALLDGTWGQTTRMVYLSGPIDDVTGEQAADWRTWVAGALSQANVATFDPFAAFTVGSPQPMVSAESVVAINRAAIQQSDVVLANLTREGRAVGTCREIEYAMSLGKRVIVVIPDNGHLFLHDVQQVRTLQEAVAHITGNGAYLDAGSDCTCYFREDGSRYHWGGCPVHTVNPVRRNVDEI